MNIRNLKRYFSDSGYRFAVNDSHGFYNKLPDAEYLNKKFKSKFGKELNLDNPQTYNEKLQWLKLNDRRPEYIIMADKYSVKEYVANIIGEEYIIPTIGVWDNFEDIDFYKLPDRFVLKCTHDSGGLVLVRDKEHFNVEAARKKLEKCLKRNYFWFGREWPYKEIRPRIIAEEYLSPDDEKGLIDYKFFCFNGCVKCLYVSENSHLSNQKIQFFDKEFNPLSIKRSDYADFDILPLKPVNYDLMIEIAEKLSKNITHIRVDMYEINKKVYFSELTLFTSSGFVPFEDDKWDQLMGEWIEL